MGSHGGRRPPTNVRARELRRWVPIMPAASQHHTLSPPVVTLTAAIQGPLDLDNCSSGCHGQDAVGRQNQYRQSSLKRTNVRWKWFAGQMRAPLSASPLAGRSDTEE